tara:strand:- start:466 stop:1011 length:546 start_codon:yes stop_codon:yes gene_type:complete
MKTCPKCQRPDAKSISRSGSGHEILRCGKQACGHIFQFIPSAPKFSTPSQTTAPKKIRAKEADPTLGLFPVARARSADPVTSHEAAASITSEALRASQGAVLSLLRLRGPMTDSGIFAAYGVAAVAYETKLPSQSVSGMRTRRAELVQSGLVEFSGDFENLPSGRRSKVWRAVSLGTDPTI